MEVSKQNIIIISSFCAILAFAVYLTAGYVRYLSRITFNDDKEHLTEIYLQVTSVMNSFDERNFRIMHGWEAIIYDMGDAETAEYINTWRRSWGFNHFMFVDKEGRYADTEGNTGHLPLDERNGLGTVFALGQSVATRITHGNDKDVTIYAVPTKAGTFCGINYSAVAMCFSKENMASRLNIGAFGGVAKVLILNKNADVIAASSSAIDINGNFIKYLQRHSTLDETMFDHLANVWGMRNSHTDVLKCKIDGIKSYLLYQEMKHSLLISIVPERMSSEALVKSQHATIATVLMIGALFLMFSLSVFCLKYATQRRISRTQLRYKELLFDMLSDTVDDIFVLINATTYMGEYISPNIERLLGVNPSTLDDYVEYIMTQVTDAGVDGLTKEKVIAIPIGQSLAWEFERQNSRTGESRHYRETMYHVSIMGLEKYILILSDRTNERKMMQRLEAALEVAKSANAAKSSFLSNMSHDIRTPMNAIIGFAALLEKFADRPIKVREYIKKISSAGQTLLALINNVLDMSKIESGKTSLHIAPFSLPLLFGNLYSILKEQSQAKNQTFLMHTHGAVPEVLLGDSVRITQIFTNLISNAVKYTPAGGKIDFDMEEIPTSVKGSVMMRFIVEDNGVGMSEEYAQKVFEPFTREENGNVVMAKGTGLGCAITKSLVDLMGGTISLKTALGKGTAFTVDLPLALPAQDLKNETDDDFYQEHNINRLLVVDDDKDACQSVEDMLLGSSINVDCIYTGQDAIDIVEAAHQAGEDYSVILVDWKMPGMDGIEVAKRMRASVPKDVPIFILTAYDCDGLEAEAEEAGIDALMAKPFFVSSFRNALERAFAKRGQKKDSIDGGEITENKQGKDDINKPDAELNGYTFLIAEDNDFNAEILSEILALEGARFDVAHNGKEAADRFGASAKGYYDIILMDVQMPVMNGYEATRAIRQMTREDANRIPIVAITANAFTQDIRDALDAGMNAHIAKPLDMNKLCRLSVELIKEYRGGDKKE